MRTILNTYTSRFRRERRVRTRTISVLVILALLVAVFVFWQLRFTGVAAVNETYCGLEEHVHGPDCYAQVLTCGLEEIDAEVVPPDSGEETHVHGEDCYETVLTCDLPEHIHTASCLSDETADVETAADWEATLPEEISDNWAEAVVAVAESQLGYAESERNFTLAEDGETRQGYTRYGAWYGNAYGDWDAMFVSFCLHYAGVDEEVFPQASGVYAWLAELEKPELEDETGEAWLYADAAEYKPLPGDLIFLDTGGDGEADRVGIVVESESETDEESEEETIVSLTVIEGDCGDAVRKNEYAPDDARIVGYGILPEQEPELVTYSAGDGGVAVSVTVASDALPEDARLQVVRYDEKSEDYAAALALVESAADSDEIRALAELTSAEEESEPEQVEDSLSFRLGAAGDTVSDTVVLDIFFSSDGAEVEPKTAAEVTIDASELLADSDVIVESLEVWHLEETDEGKEPVLVAAADGAATAVTFTVDSFSEFEFHYTCSGGGWAGFGANPIDENGNTITATVSGDYTLSSDGRYTTTVDMPYTFSVEDFAKVFTTTTGTYSFLYATVTDPNYGDTEHTFDVWESEEEVGANELYGSEENPVVSVTIDGTAATENPNYDPNNTGAVVSKTWHFTLTYADDTSVTIPIYGNADGANDGGGKYCPKYLEINLYFEAGHEAVLNLGNGNGTYSDGDYTGSNASGGDALRYGTGDLNDYADEAGKVTLNLPSDNDLNKSFTVVNAVGTEGEDGYLPAVTVELGKELAYDYKLVGWINIATGEYYDVSDCSATAEISLSDDNVFYADWIGADYDRGSSGDANLRDDTVSTEGFVTFRLFDYNELFNLYSVKLEQNGTAGESWTDSESLYSEPLLSRTDLTSIGKSFIFQNNGTTHTNSHVLSHANPARWNLWTANTAWSGEEEYNFVLDAKKYWNIESPDSTILGMLYDKDEKSLGVHYVGEGDYLFWIDENGYYTYDSAESGAAYNQSEGRFYVYNDKTNAFFPYNGHTEERTSSNGLTDYWFGMYMQVDFYLPSNTAAGSENNPVNQVETKDGERQDMTFDFSGDDDIMIFMDGELIVDMSGIHSTSYARINFSTNTVTYSMGLDENGAPDTTGAGGKYAVDENLNLSAGNHTMQIFYMERGASASNLKIQFNVTPAWEYETGPLQAIYAQKQWHTQDGEEMQGEDTADLPAVNFGLFQKMEAETDYTVEGSTYTIVSHHTYDGTDIYDSTYRIGEDGYDRDENGEITAWLTKDEDGNKAFYVRVSIHELTYLDLGETYVDPETGERVNSYGWYYTWELLEPDGEYLVLELSDGLYYNATTETEKQENGFYFWTIIGESEIEEMIQTAAKFDEAAGETTIKSGETVGYIILTDAAQHIENGEYDAADNKGYVIVLDANGSLGTEELTFSQGAELRKIENEVTGTSVYSGVYGAVGGNTIANLTGNAVWCVETTGDTAGDIGSSDNDGLHLFRLYIELPATDGGEPGEEETASTKYYLTETTDSDNTRSLTVTTDVEEAAEFYDDAMGELRIHMNGDESDLRVTISSGKMEIGAVDLAEDDGHNVKIYSWNAGVGSGYVFTINNTVNPNIVLQKVDATNPDVALSGVTFTLQNEKDEKYYSYDAKTGEVIWWPQTEQDEGEEKEEPGEESTEEETPPTVVTEDFSEIGRTSDGLTYAEMYLGSVMFHSLPSGTYILTEVSTPDGYISLPSAIRIEISYNSAESDSGAGDNEGEETDGDEHIEKEQGKTGWVITVSWVDESVTQDIDDYVTISEDTFTITLANFPGTELPHTGGIGTIWYTAVGLALVCGAAGLIVDRKRKTGRGGQ